MKKRFIVLFTALFLAVPFIASGATEKISAVLVPHLQIVTSGKAVDLSEDIPIIYNSKTYVPVRAISESIGYDVGWDGEKYRVDLTEPELGDGILEKDGIKVIDYVAKPDAMKTFSILSGRQIGEVVYTVTKKLDTEASATFQVLNHNNKMMTHAMIVFDETEPGTYKQKFYTEYFHLPYEADTSNLGVYEEKMADDYSYRMKLN